MKVLLDTNVLLRSVQGDHPMHPVAQRAVEVLATAGHEVCVVPQNLYEVWVAVTRPVTANGLGLTPAEATETLAGIKRLFAVLPDQPAILPEWERLVTAHAVLGKAAHDARLVAAMIVHGVTHVLTFNVRHFQRFPGITVLDPAAVVPPLP